MSYIFTGVIYLRGWQRSHSLPYVLGLFNLENELDCYCSEKNGWDGLQESSLKLLCFAQIAEGVFYYMIKNRVLMLKSLHKGTYKWVGFTLAYIQTFIVVIYIYQMTRYEKV